MASQQDSKFTIKSLVDKERNKVVAVEATKDFVDTLLSFLTLPLGTIIRLVGNKDLPQPAVIGSINNLYESVQNLNTNDFFNDICKNMFLSPRNPCEALCTNLLKNVDDTQITKYFVCTSCNRLSAFVNTLCCCGQLMKTVPKNLDSDGVVKAKGGVFVKENGSLFLVFDDLRIVPSSLVTSMQQLLQLGYTDLNKLEQLSQDIGLPEILKLLKYALTSNEPLTSTFLTDSAKKDILLNPYASTVNITATTSGSKMEVKVVRSKCRNKVIFVEAKEDFVDFMFSFLTISLGSIVKLLGSNSNVGRVDNLYKSAETLDSSWRTKSLDVLLNPGVAPQFGCPNQPLNIPDNKPLVYHYGIGIKRQIERNSYSSYGPSYTADKVEGGVITKPKTTSLSYPVYSSDGQVYISSGPFYTADKVEGGVITKPKTTSIPSYTVDKVEGGVITKSKTTSIAESRQLANLDPRSPDRTGLVGFVKRPAFYAIEDDLKVRPMASNSCLFYLQELGLPLNDLEIRVLGIGEAEALNLLRASLKSNSTLTGGLEDFLKLPKQESESLTESTTTSRLDNLSKRVEV